MTLSIQFPERIATTTATGTGTGTITASAVRPPLAIFFSCFNCLSWTLPILGQYPGLRPVGQNRLPCGDSTRGGSGRRNLPQSSFGQ